LRQYTRQLTSRGLAVTVRHRRQEGKDVFNIPRCLALLPLLFPLLLTACGGGQPATPTVFTPLSYDYLTKLRLNVGSVDIENRFTPHSAADVEQRSPVPPVQALEQMARDRLVAAGSAGRAMFVIDDASIVQNGSAYYGSLAVHLDIVGANGQRTGYAEARVARTYTGGSGDENQASVLYTLTKQMMDSMNVEFEYQVKRSLRDYLLAPGTPAGLSTPVQQQPLGAPGAPLPAAPSTLPSAPPAPSSLGPSAPSSLGPSSLAPPSPVPTAPTQPAPQSYAPSYPPAPGYAPAPATTQGYAPQTYAPPQTYPSQTYPSQTYPSQAYPPQTYPPAQPYAPAPAPQGY
jgi:hypothetical protein